MRKPPNDSDQIWVTHFDDEGLEDFYEKFMELENDPSISIISIIVSSYGGDVAIMNSMRDLIKSSHKPVSTLALGKAMSAGICLLASGTKGYRFAAPNSSLMFHEVSTMHHGKATDLETSSLNTTQINKLLIRNFAHDTDNTVKEIENEMHARGNSDWFLTPQEALNWGIIDQIAIPRVVTQHSPSTLAIVKTVPKPLSKKKRKA
jgi:ATP-dependent Clp protease protease subunit